MTWIFVYGLEGIGYFGREARILGSLPFFHKDSFDRMTISTAIEKGLMTATSNSVFTEYPVQAYTI